MSKTAKDRHILSYCGADAARWAEKFCETARGLGHEIDEGWMIGWFANAIETACDLRVPQAIREAEARGYNAGYEKGHEFGKKDVHALSLKQEPEDAGS